MNENIASNLCAAARRSPDRAALVVEDVRYDYAFLDAAAARLAGLLRARGLRPGDRVAMMIPNVAEFAIIYQGILRAGGVVVPMNVQFKRREVGYHLGDSGATLLFAWHSCTEAAEAGAIEVSADYIVLGPGALERLIANAEAMTEPCERAGDDTAVILYTSGTTGRPKGAQLTHGNLGRNAATACRLFGLDGESVVLGALPLFHSFGQTCTLNATLAAGGTLILVPRFDPVTALDIIDRRQVTVLAGVPTMYSALLNCQSRGEYDTSSLQVCVSGGASLPLELLRGFEAGFGCMILEGYGLSETSPIASFNHPDRPRKPGSIGTPIDGVEMRVIDESGKPLPTGAIGEIIIRGHNVMKGYWMQPQATAAAIDSDGWFRSGDLGRSDEDGYFYIVDRKKEMIIRGGYNVYPRELEEVLYQHPAVREAAVIGVPDDVLGEEVAAAIALKPGTTVTPDELREYMKAEVAAYKYPRQIWIVDELPKTATGKILKRAIVRPDATSSAVPAA